MPKKSSSRITAAIMTSMRVMPRCRSLALSGHRFSLGEMQGEPREGPRRGPFPPGSPPRHYRPVTTGGLPLLLMFGQVTVTVTPDIRVPPRPVPRTRNAVLFAFEPPPPVMA